MSSAARPVLILSLGTFLTFLDATLVGALFPAILATFGESVRTTSWVINASNLGMVTGLITGGRLADAYGRRRVFVQALVAYAIVSALSAAAPGLWLLVAVRVALGVCMALLLTSSLALLSEVVPPSGRAAAIGLYAAVGGLGTILGPLVGALITRYLAWRWAFLVPVPICLGGVAGALRLPSVPPARAAAAVNWPMGAVAGVASASLLYVISNGANVGAASVPTLAAFLVAALAGGAVLASELRSADPLFPRALRHAGFALPLLGGMALGFAFGTGLFSLPIFVTQVQGRSVTEGSLVLAPTAVVSVVFAVLGGRLAQRFGYRVACGTGLVLSTGALLLLMVLGSTSTPGAVLATSAAAGIGLGMGFPVMAGLALQEAGDVFAGVGTGWYNTCRVLGIALGVTVFALGFSGRLAASASAGREWLASQVSTAAAAEDRAQAMDAFDRIRSCVSTACRNEGLASLGQLERVGPSVAEGLRRDFAAAFRTGAIWCGALGAGLLAAWLLLAQRGRRA